MNAPQRPSFDQGRPWAGALDERLWPVLLAVLLLASVAARVIVAQDRFDDTRWFANTWAQLAGLGGVTLSVIVMASLIDKRRVRRGLQLAALTSLIWHLGLISALRSEYVTRIAGDPPTAMVAPTRRLVTLDYQPPVPESIIGQEAQPLATATAPVEPLEADIAAAQREDAPRLDTERAETQRLDQQPLEPPTAPAESAIATTEPAAMPLRALEESAPRPADVNADLAKAAPAEVRPAEPQTEPLDVESTLEPAPVLPRATAPADVAVARQMQPVEVPREVPAAEATVDTTANPSAVERPSLAQRPADSDPAVPAPTIPQMAASREPQAARVTAPVEVQVPVEVEAPSPENVAQRDIAEPATPTMTATPRARSAPLVVPPRATAAADDEPASAPTARVPAPPSIANPPTRAAAPAPVVTSGPAATMLEKSTATLPADSPLAPIDKVAIDDAEVGGENIRPQVAETGTARRPIDAGGGSQIKRSGSPAVALPAMRNEPLADAPSGPGGGLAPKIGVPERRAPGLDRIARAERGRPLERAAPKGPTIDGRSREPAAAFSRRGSQRQNKGTNEGEPSEETDATIERGLDFLARYQAVDGHWMLDFSPAARDADPAPVVRSDTAATGLALLSFLGAGYDHFGGRHEATVQRAIRFLVRNQKPDGDLYLPADNESNKSAWLYSHGIATIALCEAYGMTGDRALAAPAQRAVDFIVGAQDRQHGAWRYIPRNGSDTSVSGWQVMALKSGELAGLRVPATSYAMITQWLDGAETTGAQYVYNPLAPNTFEQGHGRLPTTSMTAVGLLMRLYTGWNRNEPRMVAGAEQLFRHLPAQGVAAQPARDTYYWYYATQVMFHMRGKYWRDWSERLHPLLVNGQVQEGPLAGSWDPRRPVPDRWGPQGGRLYVTTLNLLSLEVYYRHLPIYESTAK